MPKELLIAESNVSAQEEFENIFDETDAQLIFAENGEDALLKIKLYKPDLVIADVTMPNKDGFELCKMVKSNPELQQIPFVLLAGIFEEIDKAEQEKVGADGVVTKPLKGPEIISLVKGLLETKPVSIETEAPAGPVSPEAGSEETLLSLEGLPRSEEGEISFSDQSSEMHEREDEEAIIDLTEVVDEETDLDLPEDEGGGVAGSQEPAAADESLLAEESFDEAHLEGIDFEGTEEDLDLEELDLTETKADDAQEQIEEGPESETDLDFQESDGDLVDREEGAGSPDEAMEAELEDEIEKRIDLVLDEEKDEDDTLLELEQGEEEKETPGDGIEALESLAVEIVKGEDQQVDAVPESPETPGEETILEFGEDESAETKIAEEVLPGEVSTEQSEETEEEQLEPSMAEPQERPTDEAFEAVSDELEDLSVDDFGGLEAPADEFEELRVEDDLEGLFQEEGSGLEDAEQSEDETAEEDLEDFADETGEGDSEDFSLEEDTQLEEIFEETRETEGPGDEIDTAELTPMETEETSEALYVKPLENPEEVSLGDLEEDLSEGVPEEDEEAPQESAEGVTETSSESVSSSHELIQEQKVSEEELHAFQERLSADLNEVETEGTPTAGSPDERIELLVRKSVEQILNNVSTSVIPELTKTIVQVTSARIERIVHEVVPELAEAAIKREIERLQKEN